MKLMMFLRWSFNSCDGNQRALASTLIGSLFVRYRITRGVSRATPHVTGCESGRFHGRYDSETTAKTDPQRGLGVGLLLSDGRSITLPAHCHLSWRWPYQSL